MSDLPQRSLVDELDERQDEVIGRLDELNDRIEQLLGEFLAARTPADPDALPAG